MKNIDDVIDYLKGVEAIYTQLSETSDDPAFKLLCKEYAACIRHHKTKIQERREDK